MDEDRVCVDCGAPGPFPMKGGKPRTHCVACFNARRRDQHGRAPASDPDMARLRAAAKRNPSFEALCDALDLSPKACRALLAKAEKLGAPVHVEHNMIVVAPSRSIEQVQDITIRARKGGERLIGAISDTHLGSKHCLRGAIRETVKWMHDQGVRDIVHSGDVLEGCYRHSQYELSHSGFDEQIRDAAKVFPELPGLSYHFISGNHDYTFEEHTGMRCGQAIENGMRALGRSDWHCYGDRNAYLRLGGAVINLFHPRGSGAYARSYKLQKKIEGYTAIKPHMTFMGHYHQFCYVYERGIHGFQMPCFQGSGSNFAQSLGGAPAIGGLVIRWHMSETDRIHAFSYTPRFFFERDDVFHPRNDLTMDEVPAVGREQRYRKGRVRE